jgi:hypothetical protein
MKTVCLLNGSLRGEKAASHAFLNVVSAKLNAVGVATERVSVQAGGGGYSSRETLGVVAAADAIVVAFPLFSYTLPGGLTAFLEDFSSAVRGGMQHNRGAKVFAIVNCGFPEPWIMREAIRVVRNFCARTGLSYRFSIAIASGPVTALTMKVPLLNPRLKKAFANIVKECSRGEIEPREDVFLPPIIPRGIVLKMKEHYENKSPLLRSPTARAPAGKNGSYIVSLVLVATLSTLIYGAIIPALVQRWFL